MRFADYGRKSVFSDKSDSVDNQHRMSLDYAKMHFSGKIDSFEHYSDEDYTGANTNRPGLQRLISDIKAGMIDVLIVYQLDRLSRDVRDFANLYSVMQENRVEFVSVKENIDTTTPIGRAMMYVTIVFAQMERETIAERVTDNMLGLAKKGYWVGGNPPYGYVREQIIVDGRKHVTISPDPAGVEFVKKVMGDYLEIGGSIQRLETHYKHIGLRTPRGAFFSSSQIYKILTMPYCVEAIPEIYDYYAAKGCIMDPGSPRDQWDGSHGVMIYGRTTEKNKKHVLQPPEKWIVCIGYHEPFMSAEKWLSVQSRLSVNKFDKTMKHYVPLLKGAVRCRCGSLMGVARKRKVDGSVSSWYYCTKHSRQGEEACPGTHAIKVDLLDNKVLEIFRTIEADPAAINEYAGKDTEEHIDINVIKSQAAAIEKKISKLTDSLTVAENSSASKYIVAEIEKLDTDLNALRMHELSAIALEREVQSRKGTAKEHAAEIARLIRDFESFDSVERNEIVKSVVSGCVWDGETLSLCL